MVRYDLHLTLLHGTPQVNTPGPPDNTPGLGGWWGCDLMGGATHSLGANTTCETTDSSFFVNGQLLDFQCLNVQPPLFRETQGIPFQINIY